MVEAAANMYCKPPVPFETNIWEEDGKTVLEVVVPRSEQKPHKARAKDGSEKVYVRVNDQNILANGVLLEVGARQKRKQGTCVKMTQAENVLLSHLSEHPARSMSSFR